MSETIDCILCRNAGQRPLFTKPAENGELFRLVQCTSCGLRYLSPRPAPDEIGRYYTRKYFTRRTDRGYDDYFSDELRREIERVMELNLRDLGFYRFEESLTDPRRVLDIGCAAGYFVAYMKNRGWDSQGIDISADCVRHAKERLSLDVRCGDYLTGEYRDKFHLITLWASLEHLHRPDLFLEKIHSDLAEGGRLYLTTCRAGGASFMRFFGQNWRFYNFPEHLYFFSYSQLKRLLEMKGFRVERCITYGSGWGKPGGRCRKAADYLARHWKMGDMMLISAVRAR